MSQTEDRWELYRVLADPVRMRVLALCGEAELAIGELSALLSQSQPNMSRHAGALRDAGLLAARKHGTWHLLRLQDTARTDPVVRDALATGRALCSDDGTLSRIEATVAERDAKARDFFARSVKPRRTSPPAEVYAYLGLLRWLMPSARLAIDAGTGDGSLLETIAPVFDHVIGIDRSETQLDLARSRVADLSLENVELRCVELGTPELLSLCHKRAPEGADAVFASRVLHHAPLPQRILQALTTLLRPGGLLFVLDYPSHEDAAFAADQADLWLGFSPEELHRMMCDAGLVPCGTRSIPPSWRGTGPDRHLDWVAAVAKKPEKEGP